MGNIITPAGAYPHNPFVGPRPMKFPYTTSAQIAQFPFVFHWKYSVFFRFLIYGLFVNIPIFYKLQKISYSPSNVEEWKERRRQWYEVKHPPEWDCY